ncbi:MAG: hypothetical protein OEY89_06420 [Gammaproteobacteria bacterium]|nr:hypothetical protein [Gammaproteobacteria bacterium]
MNKKTTRFLKQIISILFIVASLGITACSNSTGSGQSTGASGSAQ